MIHPTLGYEVTVEELKADVQAAKESFSYVDFCFTWGTVQMLLERIEELENKNASI